MQIDDSFCGALCSLDRRRFALYHPLRWRRACCLIERREGDRTKAHPEPAEEVASGKDFCLFECDLCGKLFRRHSSNICDLGFVHKVCFWMLGCCLLHKPCFIELCHTNKKADCYFKQSAFDSIRMGQTKASWEHSHRMGTHRVRHHVRRLHRQTHSCR